MKIVIALTAACALLPATSAMAQSKPVACAYDQLSAEERANIGAAIAKRDDTAMNEGRKLIIKKIETCPNGKSLKQDKTDLLEGYTTARLALEGLDPVLKAKGWSDIPDKAWSSMTPEQQAGMIADDNGDAVNAMFDKAKAALGPKSNQESFTLVTDVLLHRATVAKAEKNF